MVLPILVPPIEWSWDVQAEVTPLRRPRRRPPSYPSRHSILTGRFILGADARRLPPYGSPVEHTTRDLLFDCEVLIKALLRRARRTIGPHVTAAIQRISHSFEPASGTVAICASDAAVVAWMMAAMRWQGMTHPQSLIVPSLHPPTAVVHWLAHFGVEQQLVRGRAILDLLVMRFHIVAERCRKHIRAVMACARRAGRAGQTLGVFRCAL